MSVQKKPGKNILYAVEKYCNNYFNPRNNPNDPKRNYPPAFLELVNKIESFLNDEYESKSSITSYTEGEVSISWNTQNNSWQKLFAPELGIYKRVKFI